MAANPTPRRVRGTPQQALPVAHWQAQPKRILSVNDTDTDTTDIADATGIGEEAAATAAEDEAEAEAEAE